MGPHELLRIAVGVFERLQIPYLITGSVASMAYGEPRLTNDIDIVAEIQPAHIGALLAAFPRPDYYLDEEMMREALVRCGQFNIIHPGSGLKIDVMIRANTAFDDSRFARTRRLHPAKDFDANFAAPEDVILKKMAYYKEGGSDKHLRDITGIMRISGTDVDRNYIASWAAQLGVQEVWEAILRRLDS